MAMLQERSKACATLTGPEALSKGEQRHPEGGDEVELGKLYGARDLGDPDREPAR
jgi:hypothetical protein